MTSSSYEVENGVGMETAARRYPALKSRVGDEGLLELRGMFDSAQHEWKNDVLDTASDRFERRLSEEAGKVRVEIASTRVEILRWSFAFWVSSLAANVALFHFFLSR